MKIVFLFFDDFFFFAVNQVLLNFPFCNKIFSLAIANYYLFIFLPFSSFLLLLFSMFCKTKQHIFLKHKTKEKKKKKSRTSIHTYVYMREKWKKNRRTEKCLNFSKLEKRLSELNTVWLMCVSSMDRGILGLSTTEHNILNWFCLLLYPH